MRIKWLDCARGYGVLLVVIGHLLTPAVIPIVYKAIYSFHMPMFFICSGLLYKHKADGRIFIEEKARRLLIPSVSFVLLGLIALSFKEGFSSEVLIEASFFRGHVPYNAPAWFFIVLFEVYSTEWLLYPIKRRVGTVAACILLFLVGAVVYSFDLFVPFGLDKAIIGAGFFSFGEILRDKGIEFSISTRQGVPLIALFLLIWFVFGVVANERVSFLYMSFGNYLYFIVAAIAGSLAFYLICEELQDSAFSQRCMTYASNSIFIIGTHQLFVTVFTHGLERAGEAYPALYALLAILAAIALLELYSPLCAFLDAKAPFLTGKK